MAEFQKDSEEYKMFGDFYQLTKRWYEGVKEIKEYDVFTTEINRFTAKYKGGKCGILAKKMALALNNYVDELYYAYKETKVH